MDRKSSSVVFPKDMGLSSICKSLQLNKLEPRSNKVFFVGSKETKEYYFYNPSEHKVLVAREGVF